MRFCELQKASGITFLRKKCYSLLRWPCLLQDITQQTFTVQNKPAAVAPKKPSPIISSFLELGRRKLSMQPKFVAAQKMLFKTETQQTFVNGLLGFITLGIYTPLGALCIAHNSAWVAHRRIYLLLINILLGSFQLFLHDQPLSEGEIIPFSSVCQSGEAALSTPKAAWWPTDWQTVRCATDDDQRQHHHAEHHFQL